MRKPAGRWKPVPVAVQVKRHHKAVVAARKAAHAPHAGKAKRSQAAKKAAATRAKHRKWSPDEDVALCSARAVAEALRIVSGRLLSDDDVLAVYWSAATDADSGISILDALTAAQELFLLSLGALGVLDLIQHRVVRAPVDRDELEGFLAGEPDVDQPEHFLMPADHRLAQFADGALRHVVGHADSIILGLDLQCGEPHAVVAHGGAWWSWGEPYHPSDFPGAVIDEAWAVTLA